MPGRLPLRWRCRELANDESIRLTLGDSELVAHVCLVLANCSTNWATEKFQSRIMIRNGEKSLDEAINK